MLRIGLLFLTSSLRYSQSQCVFAVF